MDSYQSFRYRSKWGIISLTAAFLIMNISGCSTSKKVSYVRGNHINDKVEVGALDHIKYQLQVMEISPHQGDCSIRITYIEYRDKRVTPLYEELKVTKTESYDPNIAELVADTIAFPFYPILNDSGLKLAGYKSDTEKKRIGLVEGKTRTNGLLEIGPKPLANKIIAVHINGQQLEKASATDREGIINIPAKAIADAYLTDKRVEVTLKGENGNFTITHVLTQEYLEKALNIAYELNW